MAKAEQSYITQIDLVTERLAQASATLHALHATYCEQPADKIDHILTARTMSSALWAVLYFVDDAKTAADKIEGCLSAAPADAQRANAR